MTNEKRHGETLFLSYERSPELVTLETEYGDRLIVPYADLVAFVEGQAWVRVEDRLPEMEVDHHGEKRSIEVLTYGNCFNTAVYEWDERRSSGRWRNYNFVTVYVTHWRPLPLPPESKS